MGTGQLGCSRFLYHNNTNDDDDETGLILKKTSPFGVLEGFNSFNKGLIIKAFSLNLFRFLVFWLALFLLLVLFFFLFFKSKQRKYN